mgnify:CR=1 FL=1
MVCCFSEGCLDKKSAELTLSLIQGIINIKQLGECMMLPAVTAVRIECVLEESETIFPGNVGLIAAVSAFAGSFPSGAGCERYENDSFTNSADGKFGFR